MKKVGTQWLGAVVVLISTAAAFAAPRRRRPRPRLSHHLQLRAAQAMVLAWCAEGRAVVPMGALLGASLWRVSKIARWEAAGIVTDPAVALRASHEAVIACGLYPP